MSLPLLNLKPNQVDFRCSTTELDFARQWGDGLKKVVGFLEYFRYILPKYQRELANEDYAELCGLLQDSFRLNTGNIEETFQVKTEQGLMELTRTAVVEGLRRGDSQMARVALMLEEQAQTKEDMGDVTINIVPYRIEDESIPRIIEQCHDELLVQMAQAFVVRCGDLEKAIATLQESV